MNWKNVVISGIAGGIVLLIFNFLFSFVATATLPFDIFSIGGMRAMDDPVMGLYFAGPFVFAYLAAVVYDIVKGSFVGSPAHRGVCFGFLLFLVATVPDIFVIYTSMTYPAGFYLSSLLTGVIGYPVMGMCFAAIWDRFE